MIPAMTPEREMQLETYQEMERAWHRLQIAESSGAIGGWHEIADAKLEYRAAREAHFAAVLGQPL